MNYIVYPLGSRDTISHSLTVFFTPFRRHSYSSLHQSSVPHVAISAHVSHLYLEIARIELAIHHVGEIACTECSWEQIREAWAVCRVALV